MATSVMRKGYQRLTPRRVKELLKELEKTGNLTAAAAAVNIHKGLSTPR